MSEQRSSKRGRATGKREQARIFQLEGQWIAQEKGRGAFYRCWYDANTRKICRRSLATADLEEAKRKLAAIVLSDAPEDPDAAENVALVTVTNFYLSRHGNHIRSSAAARRACTLLLNFMETIREVPMVSDFTLPRQHSFWRWCRDERKLSCKSIAIYCATIKAAVNMAAKPHIVRDSKGVEREGHILKAPLYVCDSEAEISKATGLAPSKPRDFLPSDAQVAAFIDAIDAEHIFRYVIMALNTWARPEAICELDVSQQVDFERGLVYMNQPGRLQNRKVRPMIRLTDNLRGWLLHWNLARPIVYASAPVKEILPKTFKKIAKRANVPEITRYTLRHFMATRIRRAGVTVSREERASWMGHTDPDHRTTERWYESQDPDYLESCRMATDAILTTLDGLTKRNLFAPGHVAGTRFTVVEREATLPLGKTANNGVD